MSRRSRDGAMDSAAERATSETYFTSQSETQNRGVQAGQVYGDVHLTNNYHGCQHLLDSGRSAERATEEEERCLQLFADDGPGYEWYKNRIKRRVGGTCEWFLHHEKYTAWKERSAGVLLVSADPGCGKSVLAKHLVDEVLAESERDATICYFFFKDQDQNTLQQALRALLHQLLKAKRSLIRHALPDVASSGNKVRNMTESLWNILVNATEDVSAGPVLFVLDALDECVLEDARDFVEKLTYLFSGEAASHQRTARFLLTTRPYHTVTRNFGDLKQAFPEIEISADGHHGEISREVSLVIRTRVGELARKDGLDDSLKTYFESRLLEFDHPTYLWVRLVFDFIDTNTWRKTRKGIDLLMKRLPCNVDEAYEDILNRIKESDRDLAEKSLAIILGAARPLTIHEMNVAINLKSCHTSQEDLDLESDEVFLNTLRDTTGLFVTIYNDRVYFIHQTAREFLLQNSLTIGRPIPARKWKWRGTFSEDQAHAVLARTCVIYLNFQDFKDSSVCPVGIGRSLKKYLRMGLKSRGMPLLHGPYGFFEYASSHWNEHFRAAKASIANNTVTLACEAFRTCASDCFPRFREGSGREFNWEQVTPLFVASYLGLIRLAAALPSSEDPSVGVKSSDYPSTLTEETWTPLYCAIRNKSAALVRLLIDRKAEIDRKADFRSSSKYYGCPLEAAVLMKDEVVCQMLLDHGARLDAASLEKAIINDFPDALQSQVDPDDPLEKKERDLLPVQDRAEYFRSMLERCTDIVISPPFRGLHYAAEYEDEFAARLLLERGLDIRMTLDDGKTALHCAKGERVAQLLLDAGADINLQDQEGNTPLHCAVALLEGAKLVSLLISYNARLGVRGSWGRTVLHRAALSGSEGSLRSLLKAGANELDARDSDFRTALHYAAYTGNRGSVLALLKAGAKCDVVDSHMRTPLHYADNEDCTLALLEAGAECDTPDNQGETPLHSAVKGANEGCLQLLLDAGASMESVNAEGKTVLQVGIDLYRYKAVATLISRGANTSTLTRDERDTIRRLKGYVLGLRSSTGLGSRADYYSLT